MLKTNTKNSTLTIGSQQPIMNTNCIINAFAIKQLIPQIELKLMLDKKKTTLEFDFITIPVVFVIVVYR